MHLFSPKKGQFRGGSLKYSRSVGRPHRSDFRQERRYDHYHRRE